MNIIGLYRRIMSLPKFKDEKYEAIRTMVNSDDETVQFIGIKAMINEKIIDEEDEVTIEYSGSGDSGDVSHVVWNIKILKDVPVNTIGNESRQILNDLYNQDVWDVLNALNYDWYNNDGGYGTIHVNLYHMNYSIEGYAYELKESLEQQEAGFAYEQFKESEKSESL